MKGPIALLILVFMIAGAGKAHAQSPKWEAGIRLGVTNGVEVKRHFKNLAAVQLMLVSRWDATFVPLDYQFQYDVTEQLNTKKGVFLLYFGLGLHYSNFNSDSQIKVGYGGGISGSMGLTYYLENIPLSVGLDFRMFVDYGFQNNMIDLISDSALNIRYVF